jgi:hypothetical protein
MSRSAADRTRRLRWWPTALFTAINTVGRKGSTGSCAG